MRKIINLNRKWAFSKQFTSIPTEIDPKWNFVSVPHTWNAIDGQDGDNDYYRGTCCYLKKIVKSDLPKADCYFLEFQGTNSIAELYIDGEFVARHEGGYSTWRADVTNYLKDESVIAVTTDNSDGVPVYPQMADFTFYGGIYRDVNLIAVSSSHFSLGYYGAPGIMVTPQIKGESAEITVEVFLESEKQGQKLLYVIEDAKGNEVAKAEHDISEKKAFLTIENAHLWNGRKDPYLYTAKVYLCQNGEVIDNISTRFGCRSFFIDPEKGFFLNGESYPLRGVSRHQDRWGFGNALLKEHHEEDIELICEMGANTIRLAHYQHDSYFYDLCDEKGLIIWAEIPYISRHMPEARENTVSQMKELIAQNYNHPSIVVWGLSNEITMNGSDDDLLENHRILNDLCHEMDKTRLTTIAAVSMCSIDDPYLQIPDVISYNHYFGWYGGETYMNGPWFDKFHEKYPNIPIGMSEYGCEALDWHTSEPAQGDYTEEYQSYYHEELIKQLFTRDYIWATHVWNMFDFGADARNEGGENGQNHKGLITFDRKYKKDSFYAYKAWLSDEPFVHICSKRYIDRVEDVTKITVYSNLDEVELFANGESLGKKKADDHFFRFEVPNKGETVLTAKSGEFTDESFIRKVDVFNENYRLKEKGAILNWFDITEKEGYFSLNDKMGDILSTAEGSALFAGMFKSLMGGKAAGFEMTEDMLQMMNGFTVLRLTGLLGMAGVKFTKEQLLEMNDKLNKIKK